MAPRLSGRAPLGSNQVGVRKVLAYCPASAGRDYSRRRVPAPDGALLRHDRGDRARDGQRARSNTAFRRPFISSSCSNVVFAERAIPNIEDLPRSSLRDLSRKFVFVPAGHAYCDWREPNTPARMAFFYFDPAELPGARNAGSVAMPPRLFFEDPHLFATAQKLIGLIEGPEPDNSCYIEALGRVLAHELMRLDRGGTPRKTPCAAVSPAGSSASSPPTSKITLPIQYHWRTLPSSSAEHLSFLPGLQAVFRHTAAPLPHQPAHRSRQGAACEAGSVGDEDRIDGRLQRDEFLHRRLSQGDRAYADRLSPGSCIGREQISPEEAKR